MPDLLPISVRPRAGAPERPAPRIAAVGAPILLAAALAAAAAVVGCAPADHRQLAAEAREPAVDPAPDSTSITFGRQAVATGVSLRYAVRGAEHGPAVILLHGYSDSWYSWNMIMPRLPAGYRVYALDQRGHGDSDRPPAGYHMADLSADVLAFMDAKRIGRAVIVGHSMGSFVAQQVAQAAPDRVAGLVLVASAAALDRMAGGEEFAEAVGAFGDTVPDGFVREFQVSTIHHPVPDTLLERVIAESNKLPAFVWRGLMAGMVATPAIRPLGAAAPPTLILRGDREQVFPDPATQDELRTLFPNAELVVLPETGHAVHWERPVEAAEHLSRFLATVTARRGGS